MLDRYILSISFDDVWVGYLGKVGVWDLNLYFWSVIVQIQQGDFYFFEYYCIFLCFNYFICGVEMLLMMFSFLNYCEVYVKLFILEGFFSIFYVLVNKRDKNFQFGVYFLVFFDIIWYIVRI